MEITTITIGLVSTSHLHSTLSPLNLIQLIFIDFVCKVFALFIKSFLVAGNPLNENQKS